ncbi:MAG: SPOR domain-containing protein [Myxococcota bacterium]
MSDSRIQNAFARTTILTVGRLLLFVVAGFAIGLVIGVASEEPELLAGHVRGDTTTVDLDEGLAARTDAEAAAALDRSGASEATASGSEAGDDFAGVDDAAQAEAEEGDGLPDVAAGPSGFGAARRRVEAALGLGDSAGDAAGAAAGEEAEVASADPAPGADAGSTGGGGWAIQVGAFGDEPSARSLEARLEGKGYPIEVLPAGPDSNRWRVRVQPIGEEQAARATAQRIEREEGLPIWVIRLAGQ